jgi:hypothetical protein
MASDGNDRIWKASHDNGGSGVFSWHGRPRLLRSYEAGMDNVCTFLRNRRTSDIATTISG